MLVANNLYFFISFFRPSDDLNVLWVMSVAHENYWPCFWPYFVLNFLVWHDFILIPIEQVNSLMRGN